jgi:phosphate transport system substrate-binding protein
MKISWFRVVLPIVAFAAAAFSASAQFTKLNGAGSTFAAPIMIRWSDEFEKAHPETQMIYLSVGSGAGIENFVDGIVSFGASDAAMTDEEIAKGKEGVVLVPFTAGSIVLAYNLSGVESLRLSREAYSGIFLGKITK